MLKKKYGEDPLLYSSSFPSGCFYAQIRVMISKAGKELHITCSGISGLFLLNAHTPVIISVIKYTTALLLGSFPSLSSHCCAHPVSVSHSDPLKSLICVPFVQSYLSRMLFRRAMLCSKFLQIEWFSLGCKKQTQESGNKALMSFRKC